MPLPMYFPNIIQIVIRTRLDTDVITRCGTVEIDLAELNKMIAQALKEIQSMGRAMKDTAIQDLAKDIAKDVEPTGEFEDGALHFD